MKKLMILLLLSQFLNLKAQYVGYHKIDHKETFDLSLNLLKVPYKPFVLALNPSEYNYIAIFNNSTMGYQFYPSKSKISFNINSTQGINPLSPNKIDSFRPFGGHDPKMAFAAGLINLLIKEIKN